jgi:hypothetical protein
MIDDDGLHTHYEPAVLLDVIINANYLFSVMLIF